MGCHVAPLSGYHAVRRDEDPRTGVLRRVHAVLEQRFGSVPRPQAARRSPEWSLVQGLIGSRMRSEASSAVADALLARRGSWDAVAALPLEALTAELKGVRFPNQAAKRVHDVLAAIVADRGAVDLTHLAGIEATAAMAWLEALPGVGRKIAAQVLDTHHLRILARLGLIAASADTAAAYDTIMPLLPREWNPAIIDEHHRLMKELGRAICRPTAAGPRRPPAPSAPCCRCAPPGGRALTAEPGLPHRSRGRSG